MAREDRQTAVADLRLSVYLRPIHPEFFDIRARKVFSRARFDAELWLLAPGHVVSLTSGDCGVTEVIAPRDVELPRRGVVRQVDLGGDREHRLETRGPVLYTIVYEIHPEPPETYRKEAEELLAGARQSDLYSEMGHDVATRAFSYAVPELRADSLLVHTWHGFPAENTILKTQTLIERVDG
jgi:hypothetical protein